MVYTRLLPVPDRSFFLFGVRGVGKSTWVGMMLPEAARFDLLDEALFTDLLADPALFGNLLSGVVPGDWVVDRREVLESYTQLYLREEIRAEAAVRNLPGFIRFLPVAALMHAQTINVAGLARDTGVARPTAAGYLEVLEDTLLVTRLEAFEAKLRVRERRRPKLYWVDPGLVRAAKRQLGPVAAEERGALLEGWVHGLLRAHNETQEIFDTVAYWSPTESDAEVDFLLTRGNEHLALEVKAASRYNTTMLKGLRAIDGLPGLVRRILVYTGARCFQTADGVHVWPLDRFHDALAADQLWP